MQVRSHCVVHCTNTSGSRQVNNTAHHEAVEPELPRSGSEERAACDEPVLQQSCLHAYALWPVAQRVYLRRVCRPGSEGDRCS
jgi:hypothetical protein